MAKSKSKIEKTLKHFHSVKIITLRELIELLGCSRRTAQRYLASWSCLTSYNRNSRYYTLPSIVKFDEYGLWHYKDVSFSRYGNLTKTVIGLIRDSSSGLTAHELGTILRLNPHSFISRFINYESVNRKKHQNCYVYLSGDSQTRHRQLQARQTQYRHLETLTDVDAVLVLVEWIKHSEISCAELCEIVIPRIPQVSSSMIENFLRKHDLLKKKSDSQR